MKLIFVRHGQTDFNYQGRMQGQESDIPLNQTGIHQVEKTARNLTENIDLIISSPLQRARQTAEILNKKFNVGIELNDLLKELKYGSLAGKTWSEIVALTGDSSLEQKDLNATFDYRQYGGESIEDVKERAKAFVQQTKLQYPDKTILVTAHGGIIDAMHLLFSNKEITVAENASVHEFEL